MKYVCLFIVSCLLSFCAVAAPMKVGVDPTLKPFAYQDASGELKGFDVDVAKAACADLGRTCEFVSMDWDGLIPALASGQIDAIISGMSITEERERAVDFTRPYYQSPSQLLVSKEVSALPDSPSIGVLRGSTDEAFAAEHFPGAKVIGYANQNDAFLDLVSGRLDAVLGPQIELQAGAVEAPGGDSLHFIGDTYADTKHYGPGIGMAVKQGSKLRDDLDASIVSMRSSGKWQELSDKYFTINIWPGQ